MKNFLSYIGSILLGAFAFWALSNHIGSVHEFGGISVDRSIQNGLRKLEQEGVDLSKSTRIILEPTSNCPNEIGNPCLHIEADYPSSPRSLNSNNFEIFTPWESSSQNEPEKIMTKGKNE